MERLSALAAAVREAGLRGTRLVARGSGQWWPDLPPRAQPLGVRADGGDGGEDVGPIDADDLVATAAAGCALEALEAALAARGTFLAIDPPGPVGRTLGGALAAGGSGPLAAGFGPPRDQVLGLSFVAGNGVRVKTGGRVVKNVAGFDLAKALVGSHGAFGVIGAAHLRLHARPQEDRTRAWHGDAAAVDRAARQLMAAGARPAACEVVSPDLAAAMGGERAWTLWVRAMGTAAGVVEELDAAAAAVHEAGLGAAAGTAEAWPLWRRAVGAWPVILRVGADPDAWPEALALVERHAGSTLGASATVPCGTVRVGLAHLLPVGAVAIRRDAARRGWPVTLERADAATRGTVGLWGALPDGVATLIERLRAAFDPLHVFDVPLTAA